jgi:hypothetical protein
MRQALARKLIALALPVVLAACTQAGQEGAPVPDCDLLRGACVKEEGGMRVALSAEPVPVRMMREITFSVDVPGDVISVEVEFTMPGMYMGENRLRMERGEGGAFRGLGVLPRCPQGGSIWEADVVMAMKDGTTRTTSYVFEALH